MNLFHSDSFSQHSSNGWLRFWHIVKLMMLGLLVGGYLVKAQRIEAAAVPLQESVHQRPLVVTNTQARYQLEPYLEILEDPSGRLTINDVSGSAAMRFVASQPNGLNYGYTNSAYWVRLRLVSAVPQPTVWFLESNFPNTHYVSLYLPRPNGFIAFHSGNFTSPDTWTVPFYRPTFRLELPPEAVQTVYLRFKTQAAMVIDLNLWSPEGFSQHSINLTLQHGILTGILLTMFVYHLFILFRLHSRLTVWFLLLLGNLLIYRTAYSGLGYFYLWRNLSLLNMLLIPSSVIGGVIFCIQCHRIILNTPFVLPNWDRILIFTMLIFFLQAIVVPFTNYSISIIVIQSSVLVTIVILTLVNLQASYYGVRLARILTLSWLPTLLGLSFTILTRIRLLSVYPISDFIAEMSYISFSIMLSLILADQIRWLQQERQQALADLQQVNAHLETRVSERTAELAEANQTLRSTNDALTRHVTNLKLLVQFGDMLRSCQSVNDVSVVIEQIVSNLLSGTRGALYLYPNNSETLTMIARWGESESEPFQERLLPDQCRALSLRQTQVFRGDNSAQICLHRCHAVSSSSCCISLVRGDTVLGLLMILQDGDAPLTEATCHLAEMVAVRLELTLANLALQDKLRTAAMRDPLTGLFNRRHLDETLTELTAHLGKRLTSFAVLLIDVDHFKMFNDRFGHDAGDAVLQAVGICLQNHTRASDVVCRYGGEEFVVVLMDVTVTTAVNRAEELRQAVEQLLIEHQAWPLPRVTISIGLSVAPYDAPTGQALIGLSDMALYQAKAAGRNCVVVYRSASI